jgi:hypothetical protein
MRLGYRKHLREIAMKRIRPQRLMLIEGLRGVDHDRSLSRHPSVDVYRDVVELGARRGIVEPLCGVFDFALEDEIGARHIEKSAGSGERAAWLARVGRGLEDRLAHCDRVAVLVLGKILDETGDGRGLPCSDCTATDPGDQAILGIRRAHRAVVMVMPAIRLFRSMTVIEQIRAPLGVMAPSPKRTTIVVDVVVIDSVLLTGMALAPGSLGIRRCAHGASPR